MSEKRSTYFPPYLNAKSKTGERSHGPAVARLQRLLLRLRKARSIGPAQRTNYELRVTGVYDDVTITWVCIMQSALGFLMNGQDGNFGPATRARLIEHFGIDVEKARLRAAGFSGPTYWADLDGTMKVWPPKNNN